MSDPINIRYLAPGTRIALLDGAWVFARYLESPRDPALVGEEEMIFAQDVVEVRG